MDWSVITGQSIGAVGGAITSWLITWLVARRRTQHQFRFEYNYNQEQEPVFQEAREIPQGRFLPQLLHRRRCANNPVPHGARVRHIAIRTPRVSKRLSKNNISPASAPSPFRTP